MIEFQKFPKIPRLNRECIITEKIDGTNGLIAIVETNGIVQVLAGSRNRWILPGKTTDNYEFAAWVRENEPALIEALGPGYHYGEWWGRGIARNYGLDERRFSLFNVSRWDEQRSELQAAVPGLDVVPLLTRTAPTIWHAAAAADECLYFLQAQGSVAARGFMRPEGIVVMHTAANILFKATIEGDEKPKGSLE